MPVAKLPDPTVTIKNVSTLLICVCVCNVTLVLITGLKFVFGRQLEMRRDQTIYPNLEWTHLVRNKSCKWVGLVNRWAKLWHQFASVEVLSVMLVWQFLSLGIVDLQRWETVSGLTTTPEGTDTRWPSLVHSAVCIRGINSGRRPDIPKPQL